MSHKKHEEPAEGLAGFDAAIPAAPDAQEPPVCSYESAIDAIACGVKKLCDAGMGAGNAGPLAADIYYRTNKTG